MWTVEDMENAVKGALSSELSAEAIADLYAVPLDELQRRVDCQKRRQELHQLQLQLENGEDSQEKIPPSKESCSENGTSTSTHNTPALKMDRPPQQDNQAAEEASASAPASMSKAPAAIKIKTEPDLAAAAAAVAAGGGSSSSSSSSSGSSLIGSEEISASMASVSDVTPTNPWSSTKCIFCGQVLTANDDPKLLECLHAACKHCVTSRLKENPILEADGIATENIVVCPRCLVNCRESMIIDNYFLSESLMSNSSAAAGDGTESGDNKMADLKCGSCPENATATSWCVECAEFICEACVQAHLRLKITKEHTIKPKEEAEPENNSVQQGVLPKSQLCSVHRQERLTLFCEACDRLTCRDCQLSSHRDHKYKFINEIAAETRTLIASLLSEVTYKRVLLKSAMKVIDDRQRLILDKRKELVNDITQMVVKLTNTINTRGKQLVVRLNDVCDAKQVTLNEKKQALDQLSNLTDDCIEFVNNALDQGSDMALLASKTNLTSHLQRIKSRRADIPNPEIPVRISLALDKVPELIKALFLQCWPQVELIVLFSATIVHFTFPEKMCYQMELAAFMASHAMRTTSPQNQQIAYVHRLGGPPNVIVTASSTQPGYLPPPQGHPPHMVSAQGQHAARYPPPYQQGQQQHGRPPAGSYSSAARQLVQRVQSPHSSNQLQQQQQQSHRGSPAAASGGSSGILWHIPQQQQQQQQSTAAVKAAAAPPPPPLIQLPLAADDTSFKITLKQQINSQTTAAAATGGGSKTPPVAAAVGGGTWVTSSVPKTPSPHPPSSKANDDAEKCLDKFCQDSVNDLMMTIAKLDSHGTKVIAEGGGGAETNGPLVDSSTDSPHAPTPRPAPSTQGNTHRQSQSQRESQKDDPNEDWCAVCLDGGEPVLCCDYCPKVFHIKCHIPRIPDFPDESDPWQCLLCTDMVPLSNKVAEIGVKRKASTGLSPEEQKLVERILLELYCQYDPSLHFREIVSPENTGYYEVIKKPMSFEKVRQKLDPADATVEKYSSVEDVISDIRLIFKNAYIYNSINSQVYTDAKTLEELLDQMLEKWIPALAVVAAVDSVQPAAKRVRRAISD
ncbi:hypothetical protein LSTR_LSTR004230 [Laodelphax striatellus]|uniref:E3 ubiquitin-protein ligase TRIM33 n=1 Tax=Laodelphax striatellus TaxID=195883 RepID=A0A482XDD9_LAOST|nr:hypothetical protein LSTR_LSTR004230 [Laodelphax striatellus]